MIKCHLSTLMGAKKLKVVTLAKAIGVNRSAITALYYERAKEVNLAVIDKLCRYFQCKVSDLLEYQKKR
jgi:putative transcriptional regulator